MKLTKKRGFTLVETVCALALLVLVLSGFLTLAVSASRLNNRAKEIAISFETATRELANRTGVSTDETQIDFQVNQQTASVRVKLYQTEGETQLFEFESAGK